MLLIKFNEHISLKVAISLGPTPGPTVGPTLLYSIINDQRRNINLNKKLSVFSYVSCIHIDYQYHQLIDSLLIIVLTSLLLSSILIIVLTPLVIITLTSFLLYCPFLLSYRLPPSCFHTDSLLIIICAHTSTGHSDKCWSLIIIILIIIIIQYLYRAINP